MPAPTLVFGWGNPSRGDDALGPLFVDAIEALALAGVECLTDFQLQIEHALDLEGRERVLFVDASLATDFGAEEAFRVELLQPRSDPSLTTHAMSPAALLQVYADVQGRAPPVAWLLAIRGLRWELGEPPSEQALRHLALALEWANAWLVRE